MNQFNTGAFVAKGTDSPTNNDEIDLMKGVRALTRNWRFIGFSILVGIAIAIAMLATSTRLYTAQVDLNIGRSSEAEIFRDFSGVSGTRQSDTEVETELQVLRSERIAERVVTRLALHEDRSFLTVPQSGLGRIIGFIRSQISSLILFVSSTLSSDVPVAPGFDITSEELERSAIDRAAQRLRSNMTAGVVRGSRVIQIRYTSTSPNLSVRVANAIAQAYIEDQLESSDIASQRAIDWLRQRRDELRVQAEQTTAIAEQFRAANNLLGVNIAALGDAEFDRLSQNLIAARAELVELEARNRRLTDIVASGDTSAVVRETATQGITSGLRSRYLDVLRSYNSLAATLGDDHTQSQRRLRELQEIEGLMFEEIRRSAELVRDDISAARERVASLEAAQAQAGLRVGDDQAVIAELRQLERNAETVNNLYISFQQRFQEATQRQEIPATSARVLNRAQGAFQSAPNPPLVLMLWIILSALASAVYVIVRDLRDDHVRSEEEVRSVLGLEYLGSLTIMGRNSNSTAARSNDALPTSLRSVNLSQRLSFSVDNPLSHFSETLRTGKMSLTLRHSQLDRAPRVGIASCFPGEGKTTVAANFANLLAQQGARVILIDADMRKPGLSKSLGTEFEVGLINVLLGEVSWREVIHVADDTGLHIIPNSKTRVAHSAEWMGGKEMAAMLDQLDREYDFVIVDLPPLGPVVDARAILDRLDGVFFVLKWGGTNLTLAQRILAADPRVQGKCYGAFLNMYDPKKAKAYGNYQSYKYYRTYYDSYHRET
ncbi:MAG: hypothetical protein EA339_05935 [Rhodobacteraceae bacterium]|nr:MAG: hypothetical protein EA339_05935 [Paracoccaceae bacterium]